MAVYQLHVCFLPEIVVVERGNALEARIQLEVLLVKTNVRITDFRIRVNSLE